MIGIKTESKRAIEEDERNHTNTVLISILSTVETGLSEKVKARYKQVLEMKFDDITEPEEGLTLFGFDHVKQIQNFVSGNKLSDIVVHCSQGVSRSTAVAVSICEYLKKDINKKIATIMYNPRMKPNEHIKNVFKHVCVVDDSYRMEEQYEYQELKDHMVILLASHSNLNTGISWKKQIDNNTFLIGMGLMNLEESHLEWYKNNGMYHSVYKLEMRYFNLFMCDEVLEYPKEWDGTITTMKDNSKKIMKNLNMPRGVDTWR